MEPAIENGCAASSKRRIRARNLEGELRFSSQTGGFELREIHSANAREASGFVQERNSDQFARFTIVVDSSEAHKIERMQLRAVPRPAAFAIARMSEDSLVSALRAKLAKDAAADRFSGAVILAKLGGGRSKVLFSGAYGMADRERKVANTLDTKFRIGSMNKMFTATVDPATGTGREDRAHRPARQIPHRLSEQGRRDAKSPFIICSRTPAEPETSSDRSSRRTASSCARSTTTWTLYGTRGLRFEPGSRWEYSNYGMLLLGVVIETSERPELLRLRRAARLSTGGNDAQRLGARRPGCRRIDRSATCDRSGAWTPNTNTLPYRGTSAGGGYSSVGDLVAFAEALMNHKLLNAEYTSMLITGKVDIAEGRKYAYGFEDARANGDGAVGHGGGAPGHERGFTDLSAIGLRDRGVVESRSAGGVANLVVRRSTIAALNFRDAASDAGRSSARP